MLNIIQKITLTKFQKLFLKFVAINSRKATALDHFTYFVTLTCRFKISSLLSVTFCLENTWWKREPSSVRPFFVMHELFSHWFLTVRLKYLITYSERCTCKWANSAWSGQNTKRKYLTKRAKQRNFYHDMALQLRLQLLLTTCYHICMFYPDLKSLVGDLFRINLVVDN